MRTCLGWPGQLFLLAACGSADGAPKGELSVKADQDGRVTLEQDGRRVHLEIDGQPSAATRTAILAWVQDAMRAVASFYGKLPTAEIRLVVTLREGQGIEDGMTTVEDGMPRIRIRVGDGTDAAVFARDWMLTHEMVHTALPWLDRQHHWLEEGLATYVEPLARAHAGIESDAEVWLQLVKGLPQGQPQRGDRGLDHTHTWGRTYWGGALFCLLADVGIRERTANKYGLRDALRALVDAGWTIDRRADIEEVLARMDAAASVPVLTELYRQHAATGVRVDLDNLWRRLGIAVAHGRVTFDDRAPQAALRRAVTH
jgi:hypothetical protein